MMGDGDNLKGPKCEMFDRSDFDNFYTIKSLCEGNFGEKIFFFIKTFGGSFRGAKFLTRMLSLFLRPLVIVNYDFKNFSFLRYLKHY